MKLSALMISRHRDQLYSSVVFVFSVDANKDFWDDFAVNSGNYTKSIDNYLGW